MKVMLLEWLGHMQQDLEDALGRMDIAFQVFFYPFSNTSQEQDDYFRKHFEARLLENHYDAVISFNFIPVAAKSCNHIGIPYIAWVYDSGLGYKIAKSTKELSTNYIFLFDRYEYIKSKKMGLKTTFYMPLAVNIARLDQLELTNEMKDKYQSDVSFVGSLYPSVYSSIYQKLSLEEREVFDSIVETQLRIYGAYYLDQFLDDSICEIVYRRLQGRESTYKEDTTFHERLQDVVSSEVTRRERLILLEKLSGLSDCQTAFYSGGTEKLPEHVEQRGAVDCFYGIYEVYKASKINLNITHRRIVTGIPLRALDVMGAGAFLLSDYQEEIAEYFRPGIDCILYESIDDAVQKVQYYLRHEDERIEIAANGHEAVKQFSYEKQLEKIFDIALG